MATVTIIRHEKLTDRIYAVVITGAGNDGKLIAWFQVYSVRGYETFALRETYLEHTEVWDTEFGAEQAMRYWIDMNTSASGAYIGSL